MNDQSPCGTACSQSGKSLEEGRAELKSNGAAEAAHAEGAPSAMGTVEVKTEPDDPAAPEEGDFDASPADAVEAQDQLQLQLGNTEALGDVAANATVYF